MFFTEIRVYMDPFIKAFSSVTLFSFIVYRFLYLFALFCVIFFLFWNQNKIFNSLSSEYFFNRYWNTSAIAFDLLFRLIINICFDFNNSNKIKSRHSHTTKRWDSLELRYTIAILMEHYCWTRAYTRLITLSRALKWLFYQSSKYTIQLLVFEPL